MDVLGYQNNKSITELHLNEATHTINGLDVANGRRDSNPAPRTSIEAPKPLQVKARRSRGGINRTSWSQYPLVRFPR